jgi:predicted  nucleic acid-binding Zn-ribbon protein
MPRFTKITHVSNTGSLEGFVNACFFISIQQYLRLRLGRVISLENLRRMANFTGTGQVDFDIHAAGIVRMLNELNLKVIIYNRPQYRSTNLHGYVDETLTQEYGSGENIVNIYHMGRFHFEYILTRLNGVGLNPPEGYLDFEERNYEDVIIREEPKQKKVINTDGMDEDTKKAILNSMKSMEIDTLRREAKDLEEKLTKKYSELVNLVKSLQTALQEIESDRKVLSDHQLALQINHEYNFNGNQNELAEYKASQEALNNQIIEYASNIKTLNTELRMANLDIEKIKKDIDDVKNKIKYLMYKKKYITLKQSIMI